MADQFCVDASPNMTGDPLFTCTCPAGFEIFTEDGQNGFGLIAEFGDCSEELPGEMRTIGKSCIRVACPDPRAAGAFPNGKVLAPLSQEFFLSLDVVEFHCELGYFIGTADSYTLSDTLTCQESGEWSADFPMCVGKDPSHSPKSPFSSSVFHHFVPQKDQN